MTRLAPALIALVLVLVLAVALPACGGGDSGRGAGNPYPKAAVDNFLTSCRRQQGATESLCRCALRTIRRRYTFAQFTQAEQALLRGRRAGIDFASIARGCAAKR